MNAVLLVIKGECEALCWGGGCEEGVKEGVGDFHGESELDSDLDGVGEED